VRTRSLPNRRQLLRPEHGNHVWSYDFVEDRTHDGRTYRMLNVLDEFTHEYLAIRVADNGPEFVAKAVQEWMARPRSSSRAGDATTTPLHTAHLPMSLMQIDLALDSVVLRGSNSECVHVRRDGWPLQFGEPNA
jgi:hypothetical protein